MSKSTKSTDFRKVNVDEFNENNYQDDEVGDADKDAVLPTDSEIQALLNSKKNVEALQLLLRNAPVTKNKEDKDRAHGLVIRVLLAFKPSEVSGAVNALDSDSIDILMKYIYREFAAPSEKSASICLTWHEKVYAVAGVGSIIRVLTDRKGV